MLKFSKLHGNGNDYVFMEEITQTLPSLPELAIKVSNRNFGVGSDGLIVASPSKRADLKMLMYNADGSRGMMCGNGIRALAKYAFDKGLIKKTRIMIETDAGMKAVCLTYDRKDKSLAYASVDMGSPVFDPALIPVGLQKNEIMDHRIDLFEGGCMISAVSMGNPHCITFLSEMEERSKQRFMKDETTHVNLDAFCAENSLEELNHFDIKQFGKEIQSMDLFPSGVNVEIAKRIDSRNIAMRVFERGSGETLSCGTGCCAVAVAAIKKGFTENTVNLHTLGGSLEISWDGEKDSAVIMKGPARTVFEGELCI